MTSSIDRNDSRHVYEQAADIVRDRIISGYYKPGQELPSMFAMGEELGISELTMQRALYKLRDKGWLVIQHGRNTRVAAELPSTGTHERLLEQARQVLADVTRLVRSIEAMPGEES